MPNNQILLKIRKELANMANDKTKSQYKRFFKEVVKFYGVKTGLVKKIASVYFKEVKQNGKNEVFQLCEELFKSGYSEESFIAADWAHSFNREYKPDDFLTFERWVKQYISNWATCDTFCNHAVGTIVEQFPQHLKNLKIGQSQKTDGCDGQRP